MNFTGAPNILVPKSPCSVFNMQVSTVKKPKHANAQNLSRPSPASWPSLRLCKIASGRFAPQMSADYPRLPLTYTPIKEQHLSKLKLLNSVIFPINYQVGALHCVAKCILLILPTDLRTPRALQDKLYKQCILFEHTQGGAPVYQEQGLFTDACQQYSVLLASVL